jgi:hypothetical protein
VYTQTEPRSATAGSVAAVCFGVSLTVPTTFSASDFVTSVQGSVVLDAFAPDDDGAAELALVLEEALGLEVARVAAVADESASELDVEAPQAAANARERSEANTVLYMRDTGRKVRTSVLASHTHERRHARNTHDHGQVHAAPPGHRPHRVRDRRRALARRVGGHR